MNHIEAMKQWLKALEEMNPYPASKEQLRADAMTSLRQAIEQAEKKEPVAWTNSENLADLKKSVCSHMYAKKEDDGDLPLYAAPPQREWAGLTDEEVIEWVESGEYNVITNDWASHIEFARAIEAKLKEKNRER